MKAITLPERIGVDDNGKAFGLPEFLTEILFTRPDLLRDGDFCEMVVDLMPTLRALHGEASAGQSVRLSDENHRRLLACDWSNPRVVAHTPEFALTLAQFRLAVKRAVDVREEQPKAAPAAPRQNGSAKKGAAAEA